MRFGPAGAPAVQPSPRDRDVDADGRTDRVAHFSLREAGLDATGDLACLEWETWDGTLYRGCDALRSVPMRRGSSP